MIRDDEWFERIRQVESKRTLDMFQNQRTWEQSIRLAAAVTALHLSGEEPTEAYDWLVFTAKGENGLEVIDQEFAPEWIGMIASWTGVNKDYERLSGGGFHDPRIFSNIVGSLATLIPQDLAAKAQVAAKNAAHSKDATEIERLNARNDSVLESCYEEFLAVVRNKALANDYFRTLLDEERVA